MGIEPSKIDDVNEFLSMYFPNIFHLHRKLMIIDLGLYQSLNRSHPLQKINN